MYPSWAVIRICYGVLGASIVCPGI